MHFQIQNQKQLSFFLWVSTHCILCVGCNSFTDSIEAVAVGHLQPKNSPTEVCQRVLEAVDRGDRELIASLVAQKKVAEDVEAITGGRKAFDKYKNNATTITATSVIMDLKKLRSGNRKIEGELITQDHAEVRVAGKNSEGKELNKLVHFVLEDGAWKLVPSQRKL